MLQVAIDHLSGDAEKPGQIHLRNAHLAIALLGKTVETARKADRHRLKGGIFDQRAGPTHPLAKELDEPLGNLRMARQERQKALPLDGKYGCGLHRYAGCGSTTPIQQSNFSEHCPGAKKVKVHLTPIFGLSGDTNMPRENAEQVLPFVALAKKVLAAFVAAIHGETDQLIQSRIIRPTEQAGSRQHGFCADIQGSFLLSFTYSNQADTRIESCYEEYR